MTQKVAKKEASAEALQRSGHENSKGEQPVRIRVTYNRKARYYPVKFNGTSLYLSPEDYEGLYFQLDKEGNKKPIKPRGENKEMRDTIDAAKTYANTAIKKVTDNGQQFTFERFESEYLVQESKKGFLKIFSDHLSELLKEKRIGTYKAYRNAYIAFNKFRGAVYEFTGRESFEIKPGRELSPIDITPALLKDFETFMKDKREAGRNTIAIYTRALKVIFNICISKNPGLSEFYPFARKQNDKGKYKIKTGSGKKGEALSIEELQALINTKTTPGLPEHEAKLLWLFSFYCQGMNFRDIALLKYSNIQGEAITYVRQKTRDTETIETPIEIPLTDSIRDIIVTLGNADKSPSAFVFDIVHKSMDAKYQDDVIRQKIKLTNKWLKGLCNANKLTPITTYWARHSYANMMKESGESVELIRELLGHSDVRTTETYLKRFDIGRKRKANDKMMATLKAS